MKKKYEKITLNVASKNLDVEIRLSQDPKKNLLINTNGFISYELLKYIFMEIADIMSCDCLKGNTDPFDWFLQVLNGHTNYFRNDRKIVLSENDLKILERYCISRY